MLAVLLWNPAAGGGRASALVDAALRSLAGAGIQVRAHRTSSLEDARATAALLAHEVDLVVALGGDGTVGACGAGLAGAGQARGGPVRAALAVVPAGSGNDVANALGLPDDPLGATAMLPTLPRRRIDVVRVELGGATKRSLGVVATGFDGQVNRLANRLPLRGRPRYVGATLLRLPFSRPSAFTLGVDGRHEELPAWMVTVANGPTYGGGLRIAPGALMDDGLLDVVVVGELSRAGLLRALPTVFDGSHIDNPVVTVRRAAQVALTASPAAPVYADGEAMGGTPAVLSTEPGALAVLATADAPGLSPS